MLKQAVLIAVSLAWGTAALGQAFIDRDRFPTAHESVNLNDGDRMYRLAALTLNDDVEAIMLQRPFDGNNYTTLATYLIPSNLSEFDTLAVLPNGSVTINWGCFACGRYHSHKTVTVGFREHELMILGYDNTYLDRTVAVEFSCSVNLVTGRFVITAGDIDRQQGRGPDRITPMAHLDYESEFQPPKACYGLEKYNDDWLSLNITIE